MSATHQEPPRGKVTRAAKSPRNRPALAIAGPDAIPVERDPLDADRARGTAKEYGLGEARFVQGSAALWGIDRTGKPYQLVPGELAVSEAAYVRDLDPDCRPGPLIDTTYEATYRPDPERQPGFIVPGTVSASDRDARDPQWPDALGIRGRTLKRHLTKIGEAATAMALALDAPGESGWRTAFGCSGLLRLDVGGYVFLRPGKPALTVTGTDPALVARFAGGLADQPGVKPLDFGEPSQPDTEAADLTALLRLADLTPGQPYIAAGILGALAWAPVSGIPELGRTPTLLAGETGSRKTSLAALTIAAQSSYYQAAAGKEPPVAVKMRGSQSTVFGVDQILNPLAGTLAIVDDWFADSMSAKEQADAWKRLSLIGDNSATGAGGTRGGYSNGKARLGRNLYPRACILATAERLPDEAEHSSASARFAIFALDTDIHLARLTECQESSRALARAHAANIRALLPGLDAAREALAWGQETADSWRLGGHSRVEYGYSRLLAGLWLLGERIRDVLLWDPEPWLADAAGMMREAASEQTKRSGMRAGRDLARDPVRLFGDGFRSVIAGDPLWLADPDALADGNFGSPSVPGYGPVAVGWRQGPAVPGGSPVLAPIGRGAPVGAVIDGTGTGPGRTPWRELTAWIPARQWPRLLDAVRARVRDDTGWTLPADMKLRERLAASGILQSAVAKDSPRHWFAGKPKRYVLDLERLLAGEPEPDDGPASESAGMPEPEPEPGTDPLGPLDVERQEPEPGPSTPESPPEPPEAPEPDDEPADAATALTEPESPGQPDPRNVGRCARCGEPTIRFGPSGHPLCETCRTGKAPAPDSPEREPESPPGAPESPGPDTGPGSQPDAAPGLTEPPAGPAPRTSQPIGKVGNNRPRSTSSARSRSRARAHRHHAALLGTDGLWLPGADSPEPCRAPASLADAWALARSREIKQLIISPGLARKLRLPAASSRVRMPVDAASPSDWARLPDALTADPDDGIAPWVTVWDRSAGRRASAHAIVFPHLETRTAWGFTPDGKPVDHPAPALLAAWELIATVLGASEDYYRSPNATNAAMAKRHCPSLEPCYAILRGDILPAREHANMIPLKWSRPMTSGELGKPYMLRLDRNAAYLGPFKMTLGVGEPRHVEAGPVEFTGQPGYYRLASQPTVYDPMLPAFDIRPRSDGGLWITAPDAALLAELGILPEIAEAWIWDRSARPLRPLGDRFGRARQELAKVRHTPAGAIAWTVLGDLYKSFTGMLALTAGPRNDSDPLYRPDYRDSFMAEAGARMIRNVLRARDESGRYPLASYVDAAFYAADSPDDYPAGLIMAPTRGGAWKREGAVPMGELAGKPRIHDAFDAALNRQSQTRSK